MIRSFKPEFNRKISGNKINQACRNKERRNSLHSIFIKRNRIVINRLQSADSGTHHHTGAIFFLFAHFFCVPTGIEHGIGTGSHTVENKFVIFLLVFWRQNSIGIKLSFSFTPRHLTGNRNRNIFQINVGNLFDSGFTGQNTFPVMIDTASQRRQYTQTSNNNSSHQFTS